MCLKSDFGAKHEVFVCFFRMCVCLAAAGSLGSGSPGPDHTGRPMGREMKVTHRKENKRSGERVPVCPV